MTICIQSLKQLISFDMNLLGYYPKELSMDVQLIYKNIQHSASFKGEKLEKKNKQMFKKGCLKI